MERDINITTEVRAPTARVCELLLRDPLTAFAARPSAEQRRQRHFPAEITAEMPGGTAVSQRVTVELGHSDVGDGYLALPLSWKATGHERLLPAFTGMLTATESHTGTQLVLSGSYRPPLGPAGRVGDRLVGHKVAERSLERFLHQVAERIDAEADRRAASVSWRPPHYGEDLRDRPEHHIG